jgi:hypothetical protein
MSDLEELEKHKKDSIRMLRKDFLIPLTETQEKEILDANSFYKIDIIKKRIISEFLNK